MTSSPISPTVPSRLAGLSASDITPFDRQLSKILTHAIEVFCEKGYEGASMRDLSRASGMSLAGLYHYFESKEKLLYLIQKHTFTTIVERLRQRLKGVGNPEQGIRVFILNHLEYFLAHQKAMKVLSHEDEALTKDYAEEIAAIKREYYHTCLSLLKAYKSEKQLDFSPRIAVLSLFGMMNWIYTWYNPRVDADAHGLAHEMSQLFLCGIGSKRGKTHLSPRHLSGTKKPSANSRN
ncbi:MAG: hypothetical protein QOD84_2767 [Acidobacteriaceae bacterium]|jgi:AcrR family transcriptional regulator